MNTEHIGGRVRRKRLNMGWTGVRLARHIGCDPSYISFMEVGIRESTGRPPELSADMRRRFESWVDDKSFQGKNVETQQKEKNTMTQNEVFTVAETAKFVGVTPNTVYNDMRRNVIYPCVEYPKSFSHRDVTDYRLTKVEQFFDRFEEFRGRTKVNAVALAFAFGIDPSLFNHWKRGASLPLGATMRKANQALNGTDHEVVQRIIDKMAASKLDSRGVATLKKLRKNLSELPVPEGNGNGKSNGTATEWASVVSARDLAEKAEAVEAEKRQPKRKKRFHTANVLDSTMRHNIEDWMYHEGKSNAYVARMLGVSSGSIAGWLLGKNINMPNLRKVEALCRAHDIPMNEGDVKSFARPVDQDMDIEVEDDAVLEDDDMVIEEEQVSEFVRTQELTLELLEAQERVRSIRRALMEHLKDELTDDF